MTAAKPEPPKRRVELTLEIGADNKEALVRLLEKFTEQIAGGSKTCVSGGYCSGGSYTVQVREEQTHEKWEAELEAYLASVNNKPQGRGATE